MPPIWGMRYNEPETAPEDTDGEDEMNMMDNRSAGGDGNLSNGSTRDNNGMEVVARSPDFTSMDSNDLKDGYWVCQPYKQEIIQQQLDSNSPGANRRTAIIGALRDLGVKVFIIEAKSIDSTADILHHVKRVVGFVARENRALSQSGSAPGLGFQRCLLYQDKHGRLLNLTLESHAAGPTAKFQDYLDTFSGLEAMIALTVLTRSFPCAMEGTFVIGGGLEWAACSLAQLNILPSYRRNCGFVTSGLSFSYSWFGVDRGN